MSPERIVGVFPFGSTENRGDGNVKEPNNLNTYESSFQRVPISVHGRYMLEDRSEYPCRVKAMSPGDVILAAVQPGRLNEQVIAYIDLVGRIEGKVLDIESDGFIMSIQAPERKRDKLAAQLTWLANKHELDLPENRRYDRIVPLNPEGILNTADGKAHNCHIIDLSISGAALRCKVMPKIGEEVFLASIPAHVVRHLPDGIAIDFTTLQDHSILAAKFIA